MLETFWTKRTVTFGVDPPGGVESKNSPVMASSNWHRERGANSLVQACSLLHMDHDGLSGRWYHPLLRKVILCKIVDLEYSSKPD